MSSPPWQGRPVWAEIDLDALAHNVTVLRERAAPARLCAVVKANAYGHGAVEVARAAVQAGAERLAVICVDEGIQLRRAGLRAPILVLGFTPEAQARDVVAHALTPSVHDPALADALSREAARANVDQPVHLEVETGLNRHGLVPDTLVPAAERMRALPRIVIEGLFTHFAAAEEGDKTFTRQQFQRLVDAHTRLPWIPLRHCAATASVLDNPEMRLELVRTGLGLYGYHPAPRCGVDVPLQRVLSLKSRVVRVSALPPGATVGYGRTWRAELPATVALVMAGYADGLMRRLSGRAQVLIRGERAPIAGRVAMDMCMVDVTHIEGVSAGDEVVLLGEQGSDRIDADDLATWADSISWEILAGVRERVPRLYLRGGRVVATSTLNGPESRA
ncbi:MAG: alanine racemase [Deltaproteobacteria bacterium]|nr:alanine racemase [Deltaproteobacteria bacterium]